MTPPLVEPRTATGFGADLSRRRAGFTPGLALDGGGRAAAVVSIWAGQLAALAERLNRAPDKHGLTLLDLLGVDLLAAQPARAIVVLEPTAGSSRGRAPAGTRVGAEVPGRDGPLVFETEEAIALPDSRLVEAVSVHPGAGTFADHSGALATGEPFTLFAPPLPIAHELFLAHGELLALAGRATVEIDVALRVTAGAPLPLEAAWWDGEAWRPFAAFAAAGAAGDEDSADGTAGLTKSGTMRLFTACAAARSLTIQGIEAHWLRLRVSGPLPGRHGPRVPEVARLLLRSVVQRRRVAQTVAILRTGPPMLHVHLWDAEGRPIEGKRKLTLRDRLTASETAGQTAPATLPDGTAVARATFTASAGGLFALAIEDKPERDDYLEPIEGAATTVRVDLALQRGLLPDAAIGDGRPLDLTKAFLPLGPGPTAGAALYLACDEPFARPGAEVAIELVRPRTAQEEAASLGADYEVTIQGAKKILDKLIADMAATSAQLDAIVAATGDLGRPRPDLVAWHNGTRTRAIDTRLELQSMRATLVAMMVNAYALLVPVPPPPPPPFYQEYLDAWMEQINRVTAGVLLDVADAVRLLSLDTGLLEASMAKLRGALADTTSTNADRRNAIWTALNELMDETTTTAATKPIFLDADILGPGGGPPATVLAEVTARIASAQTAVTNAITAIVAVTDALRKLSPEILVAAIPRGAIAPNLEKAQLAWEYFDGGRWRTLIAPSSDPVANLGASGRLRFRVPEDWVPSPVSGQTHRWLRARLHSGSYAHLRLVSWTDPKSNTVNYLPVVEPRPPLLGSIELFYRAASRTVPPQRCLTFNDSQWRVQPAAADVPGPAWRPFTLGEDGGPALYLGFDSPLPADRLGLFADLVADEETGPLAPEWEAWDGEAWRRVTIDDGTQALRTAGVVHLTFPGVARPGASGLARFGTPRTWLRLRFDPQADPPRLTFAALAAHATTALRVETVRDEVVGSSDGTPHQVLFLSRRPLLEGQAILVRELEGARADVELPLLREELALAGIAEAPQVVPDAVSGRAREVWIQWQERPSLGFSGAGDRHYAVDRAGGRVLFGDGRHGRIPPAGTNNVRAAWYRTGGGTEGNVPAGAITSVLSGIGASAVRNPRAADGGADAEPALGVARRGSAFLRHRRQALTAADYEALAREASPAVARARALGAVDGAGRPVPGIVQLAIVPFATAAEPQPSDGLRRRVHAFISARAPASLAGAIHVTGPSYRPVGVDATVRPLAAGQAGPVRDAVLAALEAFLHPLAGGTHGDGWEFGRGPFLSDASAVLEALPGVDALIALAWIVDGAPRGERVDVAPDRLVSAGTLRVAVTSGEA